MLTGSQGESGPTTPLPDKKLLLFILDRLQKCVSCSSVICFFPLSFFFLSWVFDVLYCSQPSRRKDTHGVFSEPVDPEEVQFSYFFFVMLHIGY